MALIHGPKKYVALLTQSGTDAPVATVLENSLGGTVVWTRDDLGTYLGDLANAFPDGKTVCIIGSGNNPSQSFIINRASDGEVVINTTSLFAGSFDPGDATLVATGVIIYVYP